MHSPQLGEGEGLGTELQSLLKPLHSLQGEGGRGKGGKEGEGKGRKEGGMKRMKRREGEMEEGERER